MDSVAPGRVRVQISPSLNRMSLSAGCRDPRGTQGGPCMLRGAACALVDWASLQEVQRPSRCGSASEPGFWGAHPTPTRVLATYFSLLARRRYSPTVMAFFWMLYCVNRPDWPVTTCWMGAGMTTSSMSSYVCRGFHSFGGMICETGGESVVPPGRGHANSSCETSSRHLESALGPDPRGHQEPSVPLPTPGDPAPEA